MKVLVALDGSKYSECLIEDLIDRKWLHDSQFKILTVVEPFPTTRRERKDWPDLAEAVQKQRVHAADHFCAQQRDKLMHAFPEAIIHYDVREGEPREQIMAAAADWNADLIVLGAPHNSKHATAAGTVARTVTRHAESTVHMVRCKRHEHHAVA